MLKSKICLSKFASFAIDLSRGAKNGKRIGKMLSFAVSVAAIRNK